MHLSEHLQPLLTSHLRAHDAAKATSRGPEIITDTGFDTPGLWTLGQPTSGSTTISGGVATLNSLDGTNSYVALATPPTILAGAAYEYIVDVTAASGLGVLVQIGGTGGPVITAPGLYRGIITTTSTAEIQFKRNAGGAAGGSATSLSVRKVA